MQGRSGGIVSIKATVFAILVNTSPLSNGAAQTPVDCFANPLVSELIHNSRELDSCFITDKNHCLFDKMTVEMQGKVNAERLVPFDRRNDKLMDEATGIVVADFGALGVYSASAQKISRCHVVTSAHLLYTDMSVPVDSKDGPLSKADAAFELAFHFGQTCDSSRFRSSSKAHVYFKMTKEGVDYVCGRYNNAGVCTERNFFGLSDLVILRLADTSQSGSRFFELRDKALQIATIDGERVNCWGYPGYNSQIRIPKDLSDKFLWHQENAKLFMGKSNRGILTNAIAYPGMSGGGCATPDLPNVLVGIINERNSASGVSAILLSTQTAEVRAGNFISSFERLAKRYSESTRRALSKLDEECN